MNEDPFAEPGEQDRTIIRPMPGGRRAVPRPAVDTPARTAPPAPPQPSVPAGPDLETTSAGTNPLGIAAAPLLHLLARLRNTATPPDSGDMRDRTVQALREFERRARGHGVPPEQVRLAHYALCAALDDVVLNTPWGRDGGWHDAPLVHALHHDDNGGHGFFQQLRTLRDQLPASLPVIEVMFVCLCLGMMGPYRDRPDGAGQLERIRHHVHDLISKHAPPVEAALAPDATGVDARFAPRRRGVPLWVGASVALAVLAAVYVWSLAGINAASDSVYQAALAAPPATMPAIARPPALPPPPPPAVAAAPGPAERLHAALAGLPDIDVIATPSMVTLRIAARALFPQATATLASRDLMDRIAQALRPETGPLHVLAFSDTQPVRSVKFPSNFALTVARARAVRGELARLLPDPNRISAEGRADADPIAPNTTAEGRQRNARIEILLPVVP